MSSDHVIPDELCLPEYFSEWTEQDEKAAEQARRRAEAWAHSPAGTPYGYGEEAQTNERHPEQDPSSSSTSGD